jgi:flagellar basal body P-ring protein FlgI
MNSVFMFRPKILHFNEVYFSKTSGDAKVFITNRTQFCVSRQKISLFNQVFSWHNSALSTLWQIDPAMNQTFKTIKRPVKNKTGRKRTVRNKKVVKKVRERFRRKSNRLVRKMVAKSNDRSRPLLQTIVKNDCL